ncbi:hypothetical protein KTS45_02780 [Halomicroarcula limicola]|uniref:Uncharacterized protein n=1 Tax=Haloarcula limicola TaxID=1429915 RepID=A0A8J8C3I8_9EURY|nr:hypothetical protein [Halomicroarcula limicola]MBV0923114.1 hypothetical protein [Halomicroarcula limicola]
MTRIVTRNVSNQRQAPRGRRDGDVGDTDGDLDDSSDGRDDHLDGVEDGCGCTEIWEHLSEQRDGDAD